MNYKKNSIFNVPTIVIYSAILIYLIFLSSSLCRAGEADEDRNHHKHGVGHSHEHEHKAAHGGKLSVIGSCENGHCEIKLSEEGTVELWLVGGGNDTARSVRTTDEEIKFKVKLKNGLSGGEFDLVLKAWPIELAEEKIGDCSRFKGWNEKLKGRGIKFFASGKINFKGRKTGVKIDY
ncbi:MAG TPA: hypothetical protein PKW98_01045 [Candidatus Wallbacteria bacterium]|nr:MAG: hypothetical protein BWY32_00247 [bacterium ADurb.Bin243]HPG56376.1 hypothetical protein [Candidatus Wallbacteria bacterium]